MEFTNLAEYLAQTYYVELPEDYLAENAKPLTYLKLVRTIAKLGIDTTGTTAVELFADANRVSHFDDTRSGLLFQLADLHEECELLIRGYKATNKWGSYVDNINS